MSEDADRFDEEAPEVFDFLDEYLSDREAGEDRPLSYYLARYPGHEEAIGREYLHRRDLERGKPELPRIETSGSDPRIGPYRLLSELGRGGQGIVYLAEDTRIERKVALKLLPPAALLVSEDRKRRMRREAEVVSRLDHPGICGIFDAEISGEVAYIAMPFVEGRTLGAAIAEARGRGDGDREEQSGLPVRPRGEAELFELLAFFEEAARALHAAHEAGVVHRDIKPGNLMITPTAEPVWLDFGQARDTDSNTAQLTVSGELFGTPAYMAPEQIAGGKNRVDPRIDVWALAVSLFEGLTLERPFEGASTEALLFAIQTADPRRARELNPAVTGELEVVLQTGLEKDLSRRYASALAFAEELGRIRRFEPIHARPASAALHFRRWTRRHPVLFVSIAGALLALSIGLVVTLSLLARERRALDFAVGRHLAERAVALIDEDPAVSLALGIEAVERAPTYRTRSALYDALDGCYLIRELDGDPALRFRDLDPVEDGVVAAALQDGTGRLYELSSGGELARWKAHEGDAVAVLSLDRWVVTGGLDGRVCVFDRGAGEVVRTFDGPGGEVVELCRLGATVLVSGKEGPAVAYSIPEGQELVELPIENRERLRLRSVGPEAVLEVPVPDAPLGRVQGWLGDGSRWYPAECSSTCDGVYAVDLGFPGLVWAGGDCRLHCQDPGRPEPYPPMALGGRGELVVAPRLPESAGTRVFVAVLTGGSIRGVLVDCVNGGQWELSPPSPETFVDAAFRGDRLATVRSDGTVQVWDVGEAREVASFRFQLRPVELLWGYGEEGPYLVTQSNGPDAHVWYGDNRPDLYTLYAKGVVRAVCFSPDGERALTVSEEGGARLWTTPSAVSGGGSIGNRLATMPVERGGLAGGAFDESGERVLLWGRAGVLLWHPGEERPEPLADGNGGPLEAAFQPGGRRILISGEGRGAWTVDTVPGGEVVRYGDVEGTVLARFSPDGAYVATTHETGSVRLWEAESAALLWERAHGNPERDRVRIVDVAFSPAGSEIAVARDDQRVCFYDLSTGEPATRRFPYTAAGEELTRGFMKIFESPRDLAWSPDGRRVLVTGAWGRGAYDVRDLATTERMLTEVFHEDDITSGAFSPDGSLVLTSSKDGTIYVRDVRDGNPVVHLRSRRGGAVLCADFSGGVGALRVIAGFQDGTVQVWPVDPLPWAKARRPRGLLPADVERERRLARPLEYP